MTRNAGINVCMTNNLALVVGLIARKHPDASIRVEWREGTPEFEWNVVATDGNTDTVYVVDDESGSWALMNAAELERFGRGESIFA